MFVHWAAFFFAVAVVAGRADVLAQVVNDGGAPGCFILIVLSSAPGVGDPVEDEWEDAGLVRQGSYLLHRACSNPCSNKALHNVAPL